MYLPLALLGLGLLLAGVGIGWGMRGIVGSIRRLQERVHQLEQSTQKRLPYKSADEIENAIAALLTVQFDLDVKQDLIGNALAHMQQARNPGKSPPVDS
jgi:hypothetical protein